MGAIHVRFVKHRTEETFYASLEKHRILMKTNLQQCEFTIYNACVNNPPNKSNNNNHYVHVFTQNLP